jgi:REP element-mobilizing transposase RayT
MPYVRIWLHIVWSTKNREPSLSKESRQLLFAHIKNNGIKKGIYMDTVNGHIDHVHCLVSLKSTQDVSGILQLLKGESSFWANKEKLFSHRLEWQDDYFAVSVSESGVAAVRAYINNQEEHHSKKTFAEEYNEFMEKYGFDIIGRDL